jgi:hypothetical protein
MFTLSDVVPWGRSFDEYQRMFVLSEDDLATTILGCADGPASFNAEATRRGAGDLVRSAVSIDEGADPAAHRGHVRRDPPPVSISGRPVGTTCRH